MTLVCGCKQSNNPAPETAPAAGIPPTPSAAQPKLPVSKIFVGGEEINAEIAITPDQLQSGLMFRTQMAENEGMLFIFGVGHRAAFWMKNTVLPLSCAYINPEGVIEEIHDMQPQNTNSITAEHDNIQFVLEMNQGWFKRHKIEPGTLIRTERGTLRETFIGNR